MKGILLLTICLAVFCGNALSQDWVKEAQKEFENQNYYKAIEYLDDAVQEDSANAEAYYFRGFYKHYMAYDSRPLTKYSLRWSDEVINDLEKAIKLDDSLGDAFYFLGAEYGARASRALQLKKPELFVEELQAGFMKCGYPEWYVEYGRNMLKSCDSNAILFTAGDLQYNATQVVQQIEGFRKDISVIPAGYLMGRPWFVEILKNGLPGVFRKVPLGFSKEQIMDIRPYKWDTNYVEICPAGAILNKYKLAPDYCMQWEVLPDLQSKTRTFLSPWTAVLVSLMETNAFKRPVYISQGWNKDMEAGFGHCTMNCGLVRKMMPFKTLNTLYENNFRVIEVVLLDRKNFKGIKSIVENDMPRVSGMLFNYYYALYGLANHYYSIGDLKMVGKIRDFIEKRLCLQMFPKGKQIIVLLNRALEEE